MSKVPAEESRKPAQGLMLEIDPDLLEAALASVDRAAKRPAEEVVAVELDESETPLPPAVPGPSDRERLLGIQLQEAQDRLARTAGELVRTAQQRDALDAQARELRQALKKAESDADQARARARKERDDAERSAEERSIRTLLDIVDSLERGWSQAQSHPEKMQAGVQMIVDQFRGLLKRLGVERIEATRGVLFDPEQHEAVLHLAHAEVLAGCVIDEVAAGFRLRGKMVRPARVVVAAPGEDVG
jgi:molecular chaperone GrpE